MPTGWDWWQAEVVVENPRHGYRWLFVHEDGTVEWLNQSGLHTDRDVSIPRTSRSSRYDAPPAWLLVRGHVPGVPGSLRAFCRGGLPTDPVLGDPGRVVASRSTP